jgi:sugar/nucleoside kinase (ribokinase family)
MAKEGIIAIGNLLIDKTAILNHYPQERMLEEVVDVHTYCGGGCTNVLFNLATLDPSLPLYLCGAVGQDAYGDKIRQDAAYHHIDTDGVYKLDGTTSYTDVMVNRSSGDRTFFHYRGVMDKFTIEHVLTLNIQAKIAHFAYIPLLKTFLAKDLEYPNQACRLFDRLRQRGIKIAVDLVSIPDQELFLHSITPTLEYIDYLIINDEEAKLLCGITPGHGERLYEVLANKLLSKGVNEIVIIHYPNGAAAATKEIGTLSCASYWVEHDEIMSTLGAGDAFCAGALYAIHENMSLENILKYGNACARFNLFSLSSTEGAVAKETLAAFIANH